MYIKTLTLENFRNYEKQNLTFSPDINIIYGENGQGKTNIIEALYFFCNGKSYRTVRENEVINFKKNYSKININFCDDKRENSSEIIISEKKIVKVNDIPLSKLSEIVGMLNMVIFTPDMLNIIKEGPSVRRQFIDILLSQLKPYYFKTLLNYYKVIYQRNNIIKSKDKNMYSTLPVWNEKAAEYGTIICEYREKIIEDLNKYINNLPYNIEKENLKLEYLPSVKDDFKNKENFVNQLEKNFEREIEKGVTLIGPHRDDFEIFLNDKSIKKYGSQGQMRTCVLKLKLSECEIIKNELKREPVLLLDDILSELDEKRKEFFLNNIKDKQIFITTTEKEIIKNSSCKYFHVSDGKIIN